MKNEPECYQVVMVLSLAYEVEGEKNCLLGCYDDASTDRPLCSVRTETSHVSSPQIGCDPGLRSLVLDNPLADFSSRSRQETGKLDPEVNPLCLVCGRPVGRSGAG